MFKKPLNSRFAVSYSIMIMYIAFSFLLRSVLMILSISGLELTISSFLKIFTIGFIYDIGVAIFFMLVYSIYLVLIPKKWIGSIIDKTLSYFILFVSLFIMFFSLLGEIPFWDEFSTRYNFIAVDYLIYTYEVIENIDQTYSLPFLISVIVLLCVGALYFLTKTKSIGNAFNDRPNFKVRLFYFLPVLILSSLFLFYSNNKQAEFSKNTYVNELSKNGVYSIFAAYRSNELDYETFYPLLNNNKAFEIIRNELKQTNQSYISNNQKDILRNTIPDSAEYKPNIILICIESFNADFMKNFGNNENLTTNLDKLATESILFTNMYATGTRTVRGMEAITLSVPPTPGHSIVRRPNNKNLFSIASVFRQKDYALNFFYGGDGYFDNMNSFFGGQGFNIIDRNRGNPLSDDINTARTNITDEEVTFENAWGICDEDIYSKVLKISDDNFGKNRPTFNFVMTTSNHKPYSFPKNKIDLPQGTREAAVKYTDLALFNFIEKAKLKPWFKNTVFVIIADHCASSAGKWEVNIDKHHIPALIYNLPNQTPVKIGKLASQIDIMPTVFGYLNWNYNTALYGKDINQTKIEDSRALIGNYRTVGLLKDSVFTQINDRKNTEQFYWNNDLKTLAPLAKKQKTLEDLTISYYQTASYRFKEKLMKE